MLTVIVQNNFVDLPARGFSALILMNNFLSQFAHCYSISDGLTDCLKNEVA